MCKQSYLEQEIWLRMQMRQGVAKLPCHFCVCNDHACGHFALPNRFVLKQNDHVFGFWVFILGIEMTNGQGFVKPFCHFGMLSCDICCPLAVIKRNENEATCQNLKFLKTCLFIIDNLILSQNAFKVMKSFHFWAH